MFVRRRAQQLEQQGHTVVALDWPNLSVRERLGFAVRVLLSPAKLHVEVNEFLTTPMLLLMMRIFSTETEHWVHSGQFTARLTYLRKRIYNRFLRRIDRCVFVSEHIIDLFKANGVFVLPNYSIQFAFIPPDKKRKPDILRSYGPDVLRFIVSHDPLLVMQGGDAFYQGVDRYGSDLAIEALKIVVREYPECGLLIGRPSKGNDEAQRYFHRLEDQVDSWGLSDNVYFLTGERELWPAIEAADIFLRPSNQDGDSISVREAISLDTPVVASDACPRPNVVKLFESRNASEMARVIEHLLALQTNLSDLEQTPMPQ